MHLHLDPVAAISGGVFDRAKTTEDVLSCARNSAPSGVGLSPTEARSVGGPEFIGVVTEAREEFCLTTPGAPASASHSRLRPMQN